MIDLYFFYSAKVAIVFILILSSATLEAQRNEKDKFFDLMTTIGEHFGGEFNETEKALELNLNGANSFLGRLHKYATREIVTKNENGEFECKKSEKLDFKMAIKTILDEDMLNLLKVLSVKSLGNESNAITTVLSEKLKPNKKVLNFLKAFFAPKKSDAIPPRSDQMPSESDQIPSGSDQIPSRSDQIPPRSDQMPSESDQIPSGSNQIPSGSDQMPSESDQIPSGSDQIPSGSNQIPSGSDQMSSESDQIPSESDQIPSAGSVDSEKFYSDEKLFNLLFSLAARLEALVHGKNSDGTLKEKQKNPKDKIQTFLAVPKCFPVSKLSIFDYWIEIIKMKTKESKNSIFGVAIYKEKYDKYKSEYSKEEAFALSRKNYKILKQLNDQKFSIYESTNLLRDIFNWGYSPSIPRGKIQQIFVNLLAQIHRVFRFNWEIYDNYDKNKKCEYAMFFQNISESLMKMMSDKGIDPELHFDSQDFKIQTIVQNDVEESCIKFDNEEAKIIFLNNIHYELAINFEFNQRKDVYHRVEDLLSVWFNGCGLSIYGIFPLSGESYFKKNASEMLRKIEHFTLETNRERISIIEALIGKEHNDQFNLGALFDQIKTLVEEANLENTKQLEKDIEFLKKNAKSIDEEKYQKAAAIRPLAITFVKMLQNLKEHYAP